MLNECTSGPKCHLPGFRSLHGISTFKTFEGIRGPSNHAIEGITILPGLLGIHTLLVYYVDLHSCAAEGRIFFPGARLSNSKWAKKNLARIQLLIPLWMQGCITCDVAKLKYREWIFYNLVTTTCSYRDLNSKNFFFLFD